MPTPWHEERLLVDGDLVPAGGGDSFAVVSPATGRELGRAADASLADLDRAVGAARRVSDTGDWPHDLALRLECLDQLGRALVEHAPELLDITVAEVGAPRSTCELIHLREPLRFVPWYRELAAGHPWSRDLGVADTLGGPAHRWVESVPVGVVAAITPWNVPTQINLAKLAPALAAGCTVVLKPSPLSPWSALALGHVIAEHTGIPPGVVNIVTGASRSLGPALVTDPRVDMISFTGSTPTGRAIMRAAADGPRRVFLELGGKSAAVVLDDVEDLGVAATTVVYGMAMVCGQGCALSTRVVVPRHRHDEMLDALVAAIDAVVVGDPEDPATVMGPLISSAHRERVHAHVAAALDRGAVAVRGGRPPDGAGEGWFYPPTLIVGVDDDDPIAREEVFGPVLVVLDHDGDDDAARIADDSPYGLSGHVFSADPDRALAVARRIRTGTMSINGAVWYGTDVPFGGFGASGLGREMGVAGFEEYLDVRSYARPPVTGP